MENDIETINDRLNDEVNENLIAISTSLFIIHSQISEFKENLVSARNFVKLSGINAFEEKLLKLREKFSTDNIEISELSGQRYQSTSNRLKGILEIIIKIKEDALANRANLEVAQMDEIEKEIEMLIVMLEG
ncbi:hypothetical protein EZJ43_10410 [Pedobacter changchengzhani]|uniref:Uncharacterized protein n=1 Tax=Pedobacter changchengzhani TaxID=2529274 RepID=A0A4R5MLH4_9SPHI|nr:hypothetical protein [Pedobacter changchengzhani]TDG36085.1 hypothetical protein EZJ43_10410 [Pedobacter changchengzhani]